MNFPRRRALPGYAGLLLASAAVACADVRVAVTAVARPEYTEAKFAGGQPKAETYVFMQGHYFEGNTVDRSIERMPFRRIAEYLAPQLAKQAYLPTAKIGEADLLLVVHWGTTLPYQSQQDMLGLSSGVTDTSTSFDALSRSMRLDGANAGGDMVTAGLLANADNSDTQRNMDRLNQLTDAIGRDTTRATNLTLLGYNEEMHRLGKESWTSEAERTLRYDLDTERYFIIVQAYQLKNRQDTDATKRPLWTMHLNISSPGNNFSTALERMSVAAVDFLGRTTDGVRSVRPNVRHGTVTFAPLIIVGEVKPK